MAPRFTSRVQRWSLLLTAIVGLLIGTLASAAECEIDQPVAPDNLFPQVKLTTSRGEVTVELDRRKAPIAVNNFLRYVTAGHYDNTIFHRVMADFVVQGGGYNRDLSAVETFDPIYNESGNGLENAVGSIAMARHADPHTADSQFYFNLKDNDSLNPSPKRWGYTVFGQITEGLEIVEQIGAISTGFSDKLNAENVPIEAIVLVKAELLSNE